MSSSVNESFFTIPKEIPFFTCKYMEIVSLSVFRLLWKNGHFSARSNALTELSRWQKRILNSACIVSTLYTSSVCTVKKRWWRLVCDGFYLLVLCFSFFFFFPFSFFYSLSVSRRTHADVDFFKNWKVRYLHLNKEIRNK